MNAAAGELLDSDSSTASGHHIESVFADSVDGSVSNTFDSPPEAEQSVEEYYPAIDRWLQTTIIPAGDEVVLYVRDVTERHRRQQQVERLQADLDRLQLLDELVSDILATLVDASSRDEIAEAICTRLGETELYEFAWLGRRDLGTDKIVVGAAAGTTGRTLDSIEACLDGNRNIPEARAIESGQPELVQPLGEDTSVPEPIRRAAFADGLQSMLAVPLTYGSNVYGVVGLYAADQDAFSEAERASFGTVGELAGFAVNAIRHRSLLLSDTVVELELGISDPADPLVTVAADHDATLELTGLVSRAETLLCYFAVKGAPAEDVLSSVDGSDSVVSTRLVGDQADGGLEVHLEPATPLGALVSRGAAVTDGTFDATGGRITVEIPPEADLRRIADTLTRGFDAEVVAKREREREVPTAEAFPDRLRERLTDRQESALKTAYLADYFESPRDSTSEEVAAALDITGPTLLHHLRAGQRKLLAELFDPPEPR